MARHEAVASTLKRQGGRWERWTIDEILDGHVRLLVSEALAPRADEIVRELGATLDPTEVPFDGSALHELAMDHELAPADDAWSDEEAFFFDQEELEELLRKRVRRQLSANRPLREGDVFWILIPRAAGLDARAEAHASNSPRPYAAAGAVVLDLTAAARQASKVKLAKAAGKNVPDRGTR